MGRHIDETFWVTSLEQYVTVGRYSGRSCVCVCVILHVCVSVQCVNMSVCEYEQVCVSLSVC